MQKLIEQFDLAPHPEGGYYREVYRSAQQVTSQAVARQRDALTHIYFLLQQGQVSRFHRVVHDEVWNFYDGDPLRLILFDGAQLKKTIIGAGEYLAVVPGGVYQAAESTGEFSLVGCSVAPGFDFADFSFLSDDAQAAQRLREIDSGYRRFL